MSAVINKAVFRSAGHKGNKSMGVVRPWFGESKGKWLAVVSYKSVHIDSYYKDRQCLQ